MAYIEPKRDYKDGDILYGIDLTASNEVIKAGVDDNFDRIKGLQNTKQDVINDENKLDYSLIDNTPDIPEKTSDLDNDSGFITDEYHDDSKQDTLTSGINIKTINNESILGEGNLVVEGTGTTDYDELENQPSINNVTLEGNKSLSDLGIDIPTKISDLDNDNNTVTDANYVHTDSNYTSAEKTKLASVEAGAQANVTEVVVDDTPTADTQLVIDDYDISPSSTTTEITNEYSDSTEIGFSCHYVNANTLQKNRDETVKTLHQSDYPTTLPSGNGTDPVYWCSLPNGTYWHNSTDGVTNMPSNYGFIIKDGKTTGTKGDFTVLFFKQDTGSVYRTSGNNSTNTCSWLEFAYKSDLSSYLPLSGGTLTGKLTYSSSGREDSDASGFTYDQYGNLTHKRTTDTDSWRIKANDSTVAFQVFPEKQAVQTGKSFRIPKNSTSGYGLCNTDGTSIIMDHGNQNVTVDATGGTLYLGYNNTTGLNFLNGKWTINSNGQLGTNMVINRGNNNSQLYIGNSSYAKTNEVMIQNSNMNVGMGVDTNDFRIWDYTHSKEVIRCTSGGVVKLAGEEVSSTYLKKKNVARGNVTITPSTAGTPAYAEVTWPQMDGIPTVVVTPNVGDGLTAIYSVGYTSASKTGCKIYLRASNTTARTISYIAIYT